MKLEKKSIGNISSCLQPETFALSIIKFVHQQLPVWRDDPKRKPETSEDKLNLQLCKYLDSQARIDFPMVRFDREEYQTTRHRADVSASPTKILSIGARQYTIYDPILVIECKRLPAPTKKRKKEYVTGGKASVTGGIQRFKLGLHGAKMNLVTMVGYIQKDSAHDWQKRINEWIEELSKKPHADFCSWDNGETLELLSADVTKGLSSYQSIHSRSTNPNCIKMQHLWIEMNVRPALPVK